MSIFRKVQLVEKLFHQAEKDVATFQQATGLKCKASCGLCCTKPDISATILEFLPFAYALAKNNLAHEWLTRLTNHPEQKLCMNLNAFMETSSGGFCANYAYRGLICRLFGFSAMMGKNGTHLVTCKTIKTELPQEVEHANNWIKSNKKTPVISNYYSQLRTIDPNLGTELLPINKAMLESLKYVLSYYSYRRMRRSS